MSAQIDPRTVVSLQVSMEVVDLILEGLGELKAKRVVGVINGIRYNVQQQLNPPKPTEGGDQAASGAKDEATTDAPAAT